MTSETTDRSEAAEDVFKPLHRRLRDVCAGDSGWVWYDGDWHPARMMKDDMVTILLNGDIKILSLEAHESLIADAPWKDIFRPTCEVGVDDDPPVTHQMTFESGGSSWIMSWRMDSGTAEKISRSVYAHISKLLDDPAQCDVASDGELRTESVVPDAAGLSND